MDSKKKIFIAVIVCAAVVVQVFMNQSIDRENTMVSVMANMDTQNVESEVKAYGYFQDGYLSEDTKNSMLKKLAQEIGIEGGYQIDSVNRLDGRVTTLTKIGKNGDTKIQIITMIKAEEENTNLAYLNRVAEENGVEDIFGKQEEKQEENQETKQAEKQEGNVSAYENYFSVEIVLHDQPKGVVKTYHKVENMMTELGISPMMNLYIRGVKSGKMTEQEMEETEVDFLEEMRAKKVEAQHFDNVYTVYGYTSDLDDFVYQNSKKVNVNLAFSYDDLYDETVIHMAVPFVDKSY